MVLNRMAKGAKEIDIAATLEHLRDQRPAMVQTKEQFEFALTAVAEERPVLLRVQQVLLRGQQVGYSSGASRSSSGSGRSGTVDSEPLVSWREWRAIQPMRETFH
ncbi:unnamed protein product [Gadus morhua 'NCC']